MEINERFLQRMKNMLGKEYNDFYNSLLDCGEKAIFVNENKISVEDFLKIADFPIEKIPYEKCGFYIGNQKLGRHPLHHAGAFYIQEPSAMFTVNAFKFNGDEKVLDMCASPGGKTIQIANRIPSGCLVSNEFVPARAEVLFSNVERMGLKNVIITNETPENLAKAYAGTFDVCLVDAPCSGEGMFRKGDDMLEAWNENLPLMCSTRQKEILIGADKCLKQGGHLIYSTCTYSIEENEDIVRWLVDELGYKLLPINVDLPRGINMPEAVRMYPHKVRGEGQFVALLEKISESNFNHTSNLKLKTSESANNFLCECTSININTYQYKDKAYIVKDVSLLKNDIKYISIGVEVGIDKKGRFEPFHNIFTAYGNYFKNVINLKLGDDKIDKYLKGDIFECDLPNGYAAIMLENCPLGGGKTSFNVVKNHYPKGLRNIR